MTSKWVKNGKVAHEAIAECVTSLRLCCARENPTITGYFEAVLEENSAREITVVAISSFQRAPFSNCFSPTLKHIPWVPEVFLVRFPVSVMSLSPLVSEQREENLWYPGYKTQSRRIQIPPV